jgi:hypothetical protein
MSDPQPEASTIELRLPPDDAPNAATISNRVADFLHTLATSLAFPAVPVLRTTVSQTPDILVDGWPVAAPWTSGADAETRAAEIECALEDAAGLIAAPAAFPYGSTPRDLVLEARADAASLGWSLACVGKRDDDAYPALARATADFSAGRIDWKLSPQLWAEWSGGSTLADAIAALRQDLSRELGFAIPIIHATADDSLQRRAFRCAINDLPGATRLTGRFLGAAMEDLRAAIVRRSAGLLTARMLDLLLARLELDEPHLVAETEAVCDRPELLRVLRCLLAEHISIRDLSPILHGMLATRGRAAMDGRSRILFNAGAEFAIPDSETRTTSLSPAERADGARVAIKRLISHQHTLGSGTLNAHVLDPEIESLLAGDSTDVDRATLIGVIAAFSVQLPATNHPPRPVVLTTIECRTPLRRLLRYAAPHVTVLAYQELSPELNIVPLPRITLVP